MSVKVKIKDLTVGTEFNPVGAELDVSRKHLDFGRYIVPTEREMLLGDWTPGRYAWELANVKRLIKPVRAKGAQGLWNWDEGEKDHCSSNWNEER